MAQGIAYPPAMRDKARHLYHCGLTAKQTAKQLGVAPSTVVHWVRDLMETEPAEVRKLLHERDQRVANYPWRDPHVVLLGDPPPGRSALDQRTNSQ